MNLLANPSDEIAPDIQASYLIHEVRSAIFNLAQTISDPLLEPLIVQELALISNAADELKTVRKYYELKGAQ